MLTNICQVCKTNPVMESGEKPTCYKIECQLLYNEKHNDYRFIQHCHKCGNPTTNYRGKKCGVCENGRKKK